MNSAHIIDDEQITDRVESIAGKGTKIIDCEKRSTLLTEEVLLLNGNPVKLVGEVGEKIKAALKAGQTPPPELLSEILINAGIEKNPIELETTVKVTSNTKTTECSTLRDKDGVLVDEKMKEVEEEDEIQTSSVEVWEKESDDIPQYLNRSHHMLSNLNRVPSSPVCNSREINSNMSQEYPKLQREPLRNFYLQRSPYSSRNLKSSQKESPCYKPTSAFLNRDHFELPVRVVYETFI